MSNLGTRALSKDRWRGYRVMERGFTELEEGKEQCGCMFVMGVWRIRGKNGVGLKGNLLNWEVKFRGRKGSG